MRLGAEINERRTPPKLQGVTGSPLRILGMVVVVVVDIASFEVKRHGLAYEPVSEEQ